MTSSFIFSWYTSLTPRPSPREPPRSPCGCPAAPRAYSAWAVKSGERGGGTRQRGWSMPQFSVPSTAATAAIHPGVGPGIRGGDDEGAREERVRSGREKGGGARPIVSVGARRTWSLVKLLMRASGVFLLMNLAKSGRACCIAPGAPRKGIRSRTPATSAGGTRPRERYGERTRFGARKHAAGARDGRGTSRVDGRGFVTSPAPPGGVRRSARDPSQRVKPRPGERERG